MNSHIEIHIEHMHVYAFIYFRKEFDLIGDNYTSIVPISGIIAHCINYIYYCYDDKASNAFHQ